MTGTRPSPWLSAGAPAPAGRRRRSAEPEQATTPATTPAIAPLENGSPGTVGKHAAPRPQHATEPTEDEADPPEPARADVTDDFEAAGAEADELWSDLMPGLRSRLGQTAALDQEQASPGRPPLPAPGHPRTGLGVPPSGVRAREPKSDPWRVLHLPDRGTSRPLVFVLIGLVLGLLLSGVGAVVAYVFSTGLI